MSNESLFEIFCSQFKLASDKNAIRIHIKVINQARRRIVFNYIDFNLIENKNQLNVLNVLCVCTYVFSNSISMWSCNMRLLLFDILYLITINDLIHITLNVLIVRNILNSLTHLLFLKKSKNTQTRHSLCFIEIL